MENEHEHNPVAPGKLKEGSEVPAKRLKDHVKAQQKWRDIRETAKHEHENQGNA